MDNENESCQWLVKKLNSLDIFGIKITPTFHTKLGGISTALIFIFMFWAAVISMNSVFNNSEIRFTKNEKKLTLSKESEIHNITSGNGLQFAFRWSTRDGIHVDRTIGEIVMQQVYFDDCVNNIFCFSTTNIPLETCNVYEFSDGIIPEEIGNDTLLCAKRDVDLRLQSNSFGKFSKVLAVYVKPCQGYDYWKPYEQILRKLQYSTLNINVLAPYFDFRDLENPIKYHINDQHYLFFDYQNTLIMRMDIRKSLFTVYDSVFGISSPKKGSFYTIEKSDIMPVLFNDKDFAQITIGLDNQIDEYESSVQTIFEAIGTIGGLYEMLRISSGLLIGIYTKKVYQHTVTKNLRQDNSKLEQENPNNTRQIRKSAIVPQTNNDVNNNLIIARRASQMYDESQNNF